MSGNIKFRWFLLAPIVLALLVGISPVISSAGELEDELRQVRRYPDSYISHANLGNAYEKLGQYEKAVASYKEVIRLGPKTEAFFGSNYWNLGRVGFCRGDWQSLDRS